MKKVRMAAIWALAACFSCSVFGTVAFAYRPVAAAGGGGPKGAPLLHRQK